VLGHLGSEVVGDVLDEPGPGATGAGQFAAAVGTGGESVRLVAVDPFGSRAGRTGVADHRPDLMDEECSLPDDPTTG